MRGPVVLCLALALTALTGGAEARPWCSAAQLNPTESTICESPDLRDLDARMTGLHSALPDAERYGQREWLTARNRCERDQDCLRAIYDERIAEFDGRQRAVEAGAQPDWCGSAGLDAAGQQVCSLASLAGLAAELEAVEAAEAAARSIEAVPWWLGMPVAEVSPVGPPEGLDAACGADPLCLSQALRDHLESVLSEG